MHIDKKRTLTIAEDRSPESMRLSTSFEWMLFQRSSPAKFRASTTLVITWVANAWPEEPAASLKDR